jgi:hypothetical protein
MRDGLRSGPQNSSPRVRHEVLRHGLSVSGKRPLKAAVLELNRSTTLQPIPRLLPKETGRVRVI